MRDLKKMSQDCNFRDVKAEIYKNEYIRDAFIAGINSQKIRENFRILENLTLTLNQAISLEMAEKKYQSFTNSLTLCKNKILNVTLR